MKPIYAILFLLGLAACTDEPEVVEPIYQKPASLISDVNIRFIPKSESMVDIRLEEGGIKRGKVILPTEDSLVIGEFTEQLPNKLYLTASASFQFPAKGIDLLVEFERQNSDTLYRFFFADYQYSFVNELKETQLVDFTQFLESFDFTADNRYLFFTENHSDGLGKQSLYRLNLQTFEQELISDDFSGRNIRAVSQDEVVYTSKMYKNEVLERDSLAMYSYNISTKKQEKVAFIKEYQHYSRFVDGQLLAWKADKTPDVLVIPSTGEEIKTTSAFYSFLRYDNRDNLWLGNHFLDPNTQKLTSLPQTDLPGYSILAYNNASQFSLGLQSFQDENKKVKMYEGSELVFEEENAQRKSVSYVYAQQPVQSQSIFHQFFLDGNGLSDGYYRYDEAEGGLKLIQHSENPGRDFWISDQSFISIRHDGIYLMEVEE